MNISELSYVHAVRPWDGPYASMFTDSRRDRRGKVCDQRDIDECLSCPKPECTNCKRYSCYRYGYVALPNG